MKKNIPQPIAILGAGSWGTALALYLSRQGQPVRLWTYQADHVAAMIKERTNVRYLAGYPFPELLQPFADIQKALTGLNDILVVSPSHGFRETLLAIKPHLTSTSRIAWATKGLDPHTSQLLHEVAFEVLGENHPYAVLSGPSFAREVAAELPTAVVIASKNEKFAHDLVERFNSPTFRVYQSTDIVGVEMGGVVKNVLAIATGISDGLGFGANARSALITRGLTEMTRLGLALGGKAETFTGLAGIGDLILTCTDDQSRNRRFGLALGKGENPLEAEKNIGQVVEGKYNAEAVVKLAKKHHVEMPITEAVSEVLSGKLTVKEAMTRLLSRTPKAE